LKFIEVGFQDSNYLEHDFLMDLGWLKHILANAAKRAYPILRDIFKRCAWRYAGIWITKFRIINIATSCAYIFHSEFLLVIFYVEPECIRQPTNSPASRLPSYSANGSAGGSYFTIS
jgi:hypothetical protein